MIDITGQAFNNIKVLARTEEFYESPKKNRKILWLCLCYCGKEFKTTANNLKMGYTKSCGCAKITDKYEYGSVDYNRNGNLKKLYNMTLEDWNIKFQEQGSCCAICGSKEPRGKNWHTDHNHLSGKVRGILCGWCNTGIGKLQEDPEIFRKALLYLEEHKNETS